MNKDIAILITMLLGYFLFSLIDELCDRFMYKVKRLYVCIPCYEYMELKKIVKKRGVHKNVNNFLEFHLKEDIHDILESESIYE